MRATASNFCFSPHASSLRSQAFPLPLLLAAPAPDAGGLPGLDRPAFPATLLWLALLALALALTALWLWLLADCLRRERGRARLLWTGLLLAGVWLGGLAYCLMRWRKRPGAPPLARGGPAVELWRWLTGRRPVRCASCRYDQGAACPRPERGRVTGDCPDYQER